MLKCTFFASSLLLAACARPPSRIVYAPEDRTIRISFKSLRPDQPEADFHFIVRERWKRDSTMDWEVRFQGSKEDRRMDLPILSLTLDRFSRYRFDLGKVDVKSRIPPEISKVFEARLSNAVESRQSDVAAAVANGTYLYWKLIRYAWVFYKPNGIDFKGRISLWDRVSIPYGASGERLYITEAIERFRWNGEVAWSLEYVRDSIATGHARARKPDDVDGWHMDLGAARQYSEQAAYYFEEDFRVLRKVVLHPLIDGEKAGCEVTLEIL